MKMNRVLHRLAWVAALAAGHAFAAGPPAGVPGFPGIPGGARLIDVGVPSARVPFTPAAMVVLGAPTPVFVAPNAVQAPTLPAIPVSPTMPSPTAMSPAVPSAPGLPTSVGPEMPPVPDGVIPQSPAIAETRYHARLIPACQ